MRLGEYYGFKIEDSQYKRYLDDMARKMGKNEIRNYEGEGR